MCFVTVQPLRVARETRQGVAVMKSLRGSLDESFDPSVLDPQGCSQLILELGRVTHVSLTGSLHRT